MSLETETVLFAFLGTLAISSTNVLFTIVLKRMGSFALAQINNIGNVLVLGGVGLYFLDWELLRWEAFFWFGLLGIVNYSINRWVFYTGMSTVGPSRHVTIVSLTPIPSLFIAIFLLGEDPNLEIFLGTLFVICGVILVSYDPNSSGWIRAGVGWSFMSVLFLTASAYMRNRGMNYMAEPFLLTTWSALVALPTGEILRRFLPKKFFSMGDAKKMIPLILIGITMNSFAQVLINQSMRGKISIAVPIGSSAPVFVLILSAIFLRKTENLNLRVVIGILITVIGVIGIGISRHG
ncbi:MAG: DMT family transporter [bacterium]